MQAHIRGESSGGYVITLREMQEAQQRIAGAIHHTPLYHSDYYSSKTGAEIYLKLECYQPTHVFKIRGVANKIARLTAAARQRGVITGSSGNHGIAVAYVAHRANIPATVVVPVDVTPEKAQLITRYGATLVKHGRYSDERLRKATEIAKKTGATLIHPFNDPDIIAGQGTIGLEIYEALPHVDTVIVPVGGGGLIAGIALALKSLHKHAKVLGVQPATMPSMHASLKQGRRIFIPHGDTIADGLKVRQPGPLTFQLAHRYVDDILLVDDADIRQAVTTLLTEEHILAEPSGAAPLAALPTQYQPKQGERIVLVISGGNIAVQLLRELLA